MKTISYKQEKKEQDKDRKTEREEGEEEESLERRKGEGRYPAGLDSATSKFHGY